jgi:hypothetical protein
MARMPGAAFWLCVPPWTDGFIGGQAFERFAAFSQGISHQEGLQRHVEVVMGLIGGLLHGGVFARAVHAFHVAIGPRMVGGGEAVLDARRLAGAGKQMGEGLWLALAVGE